jgi:hypothetical protein
MSLKPVKKRGDSTTRLLDYSTTPSPAKSPDLITRLFKKLNRPYKVFLLSISSLVKKKQQVSSGPGLFWLSPKNHRDPIKISKKLFLIYIFYYLIIIY